MLDSFHMKFSMFPGRVRRFPGNRFDYLSVCRASAPIFRKSCLALLFSISTAAMAQQLQTTPGQNVDCSDPLNAGTSACQGGNSLQFPSTGPQFSNPLAGQNSVQPQNSGIYTDNENLARSFQQGRAPLQRLTPEPLTEFQKFVASSTGVVLPIYGVNLFQTVPSTFAPVDMTPVPSNYVIGPGDELRIRVWGQVSFQANLRVDRSGAIYLPHVGPVQVAGLKFSELDPHLRAAIGRVYRNFDLIADMGQIRSIQVYVAGQARRPGVYTVSSLSTLVDALFASGGPSVHGSLRHIELRRGGSVVTTFDLYDLIARGDKTKDAKLLPEDVIYIPPAGPEVALTGSVRVPAIYELRPHETLGDLFKDAGGITAVASAARVSIERIQDHRDREAMEVAYNPSGLATPLSDGDIIHVNSIIPRYQNTVTIRGNIANPGRFAWHKGMRVSDLIPDKDSLVTRNYWWRRAQQGLPAPEFEPSADFSSFTQPTHQVQLSGAKSQDQKQPTSGQPVQQASETTPNATDMLPSQQHLATYGSSQAARPGAGVGTISTLAMQQESQYTGLRGATQPTQISIVAPEIDWDYATIERLDPQTLKTTLLPFDLGRLVLDHDESQNLELEPGDVVTIFSEADIRLPRAQQTKLIKLEGEFVHSGVYTAKPGETLRDLVERAGGLTPGAYLYGSEFSRESTRMLQQARIDEYVQSLEMDMQRGSMALIAAGAGNNVDQNGRTAESVAGQQLVTRLRQVRATGRIVLEFKPGARGADAIPDIPLEDGDTFIVPAVPASVNVVGAVYNQNSFLYERSRRVSAYLRLAGGPNRNADVRHSFIIRADGEVISRAAMNNLWGDSFESLRLNPGDTIVVPDKAIKVPALRNIMDWSTMFSQLALGAAYLTVLP